MAENEDTRDFAEVLHYLAERVEMSVRGEVLEVEVMHGAEALPLGRAFTEDELKLLVLGAQYGARHIMLLQLQDADAHAALDRAVKLATGQAS
jgi:hypothetical protein